MESHGESKKKMPIDQGRAGVVAIIKLRQWGMNRVKPKPLDFGDYG
ncbi:hypothetical protein CCACVL1_25296 [Corchorus capsularis]|uniref:Uncharacterized protein n=1 Tax=Corchorus capsularis TaxID=210143 RepID=A0A1R3GLD3_COCAP|nr:hypothetical protein CCACVL1_25296 [Corchorus capsularis]